jgi:hypothetical protein
MGTVTVLTGSALDLHKIERRLARSGCATTRITGGLRVIYAGHVVDARVAAGSGLPFQMTKGASELIGTQPKSGLICSFDGPVGTSDAWATVIAIAKAVAAAAPLAVLDDHAGSLYLVNPNEGLINATDIQPARGTTPASALLRRLFGDPGR